MKKKVFWTDKEVLIVAEATVMCLGDGRSSSSVLEALNKSQGDLPEGRRRVVKAVTLIPKVMAEIKRLQGLPKKEPVKSPELPPPPVPQPQPTQVETPTIKLIEALLLDRVSSAVERMVVDSMKKLVLNEEFRGMVTHLLKGDLPPVIVIPPRFVAPASAPRVTLPSCLVIGINNHSHVNLLSRFNKKLHLKFWKDDGYGDLKSKASSVDFVLATMEATSHSTVEVVGKAGKMVVKVTGGLSSMIKALDKLAV